MYHLGADPTFIFVAIYAMMFGAMSVGNAQSFGPDVGKANAAADKVFGITDSRSKIDALG